MGGARRISAVVAACAAVAGCSSKGGPAACAAPAGDYVLTVAPTGQSENGGEICSADAPPLSIAVAFGDGGVTVGGEACAVCSTAGCQIEIVCGRQDPCSGDAVPEAAPPSDTDVQYATFALPTQADASTGNALVEVGWGYCAFEGTASAAP